MLYLPTSHLSSPLLVTETLDHPTPHTSHWPSLACINYQPASPCQDVRGGRTKPSYVDSRDSEAVRAVITIQPPTDYKAADFTTLTCHFHIIFCPYHPPTITGQNSVPALRRDSIVITKRNILLSVAWCSDIDPLSEVNMYVVCQ